jgi:hypothetical protein
MNFWQFLRDLNEICHFQTREGKRVGPVSNSELKRWCQNKAVIVNGEPVAWDELVDFPIISVVIFPKNRITLL